MRCLIQFLQYCFTSLKEIKKVWAEIFLKCDNSLLSSQDIILGFLWYSVGIPVVLEGDLFSKRVSSYVCIFCAILNNLARVIYAISNCHKRK